MKNKKYYIELAEDIIDGNIPDNNILKKILSTPDSEITAMLAGADLIREKYFGREIHLCTICNGKSGKCSEDCKFCSQSSFSNTEAPVYPLHEKDELIKGGVYAGKTPINRYSIVTTGKGLPRKDIEAVAEAMVNLDDNEIKKCVSLGILEEDDLKILKAAGVTRYHHNLEASRSLFSQVCTTHTYDDRIATIKAARNQGMEVCAGGIFGIGEIDDQIIEMAVDLRELTVDSVPVNFLVPVKGTPYESMKKISPLKCLKIISFFRYFLPEHEIIICGGREDNLEELHPFIFYAGASGIMTGNYLTTQGRSFKEDLEMIKHLGFTVREK
ncbi:biotin synthase BioB [Thermodesulfobacteriota bacterium]